LNLADYKKYKYKGVKGGYPPYRKSHKSPRTKITVENRTHCNQSHDYNQELGIYPTAYWESTFGDPNGAYRGYDPESDHQLGNINRKGKNEYFPFIVVELRFLFRLPANHWYNQPYNPTPQPTAPPTQAPTPPKPLQQPETLPEGSHFLQIAASFDPLDYYFL
jgi:hypothetical protein